MRIIFLCRRYCPGEAWTNRILAYAKGLSELGCEVFIYYLISDINRSAYKINIPGVTVVNLWENDCWIARKCRAISFIVNLFKFRVNINPSDNIYLYGGNIHLIKFFLKTDAKVYTELTEHPYIYNKSGRNGEKRIDKKYKILNKLNGVFVISHSLKEYFISIGIDASRIEIVNMFVDSARFDSIQKKQLDNPYIAYCGTVSYSKDGVDLLIKSFALFKKKHFKYKLYIIGRGYNEKTIDNLKSLANDLGVEKDVVFTGQILPSDMPQMLKNAEVLALARPDSLQAQNGFPTKLGEYLASGNPALVTSVGEIPHYIQDGVNGYLVEPGNPQKFAEKLCYIVDNYRIAKKVAEEGYKLVQKEFSYKSQSLIVYNKLISKL